MRKRLNYTGRKRILQKHVGFTILEQEDGLQRFLANVDLDSYELPPAARVWIEAYDRNSVMRFDFGTAGNRTSPTSTVLTDFRGVDSFYFRVKVTDADDSAKLLAAAHGISPVRHDDEDEHRRSLLRVTVSSDMGNLPWDLEFVTGDFPILRINSEIDTGVALARSNQFFQAVVFPYVLETILRKILIDDEYIADRDHEEQDDWKEAWLAFAGSLPGCSPLGDAMEHSAEEYSKWIHDAADAYAANIKAIRKLRVELKEVE